MLKKHLYYLVAIGSLSFILVGLISFTAVLKKLQLAQLKIDQLSLLTTAAPSLNPQTKTNLTEEIFKIDFASQEYRFAIDYYLTNQDADGPYKPQNDRIYSLAKTPVFYRLKPSANKPKLKLNLSVNPENKMLQIAVYDQPPYRSTKKTGEISLGGKTFFIYQGNLKTKQFIGCQPLYLQTKVGGDYLVIDLSQTQCLLGGEKAVANLINQVPALKTFRFLDEVSVKKSVSLWPTIKWSNLEVPLPSEVEVDEQPNYSRYKLAIKPNFDVNYIDNSLNLAETILFSYQGEINSLSEQEIIKKIKTNYNIKTVLNKQPLPAKNSQLKILKLDTQVKQNSPFSNNQSTQKTFYILLDKKNNQVILVERVPWLYQATIEEMLKNIE